MKIALFDWNGTLLDDIPVWYASVKEIFRVFGKEPPSLAQFFRELEGDYLAIYRSRGIEASRDELNAIYEPFYAAHVSEAMTFPQVRGTLQRLVDRGVKLGLITAQQAPLVSPLLEKLGLGGFFLYRAYHVLDKQAAINQVLNDQGIGPEECCFVGDAPSDIRHSNKAGVVTVAYLAGYIPEDLVLQSGPTLQIRNFNELTAII